MRETAFYVCENKGPDQLSGGRTADQRLSFCYIDNTNTLLHEVLSLSVLVAYLEHRFLLQKDLMTAYIVACINFTKPKL